MRRELEKRNVHKHPRVKWDKSTKTRGSLREKDRRMPYRCARGRPQVYLMAKKKKETAPPTSPSAPSASSGSQEQKK